MDRIDTLAAAAGGRPVMSIRRHELAHCRATWTRMLWFNVRWSAVSAAASASWHHALQGALILSPSATDNR